MRQPNDANVVFLKNNYQAKSVFTIKPKGFFHSCNAALKVIVVGDAKAGKTTLIARYVNDTFISDYVDTIGVEFESIFVYAKDVINSKHEEKRIKLMIWDTGGDVQLCPIIRSYYQGSYIVIIVVAANQDPDEKIKQINQYLKAKLECYNDISKVFLVETKIDLLQSEPNYHTLTQDELKNVNGQIACHVAVSSKTQENFVLFKSQMLKIVASFLADPYASSTFRSNIFFNKSFRKFPDKPRPKYTIIQDEIQTLPYIASKIILLKLKHFLIDGNLSRINERYIVRGLGETYTIDNVDITVPKHVKEILSKIDVYFHSNNNIGRFATELLNEVYCDINIAASSSCWTRHLTTQEFYDIYLPEYLETLVSDPTILHSEQSKLAKELESSLRDSNLLNARQSNRSDEKNPNIDSYLNYSSTRTTPTLSVPTTFSRSDNLTPRGEEKRLIEPIEPSEKTPLFAPTPSRRPFLIPGYRSFRTN